MKTKMFGVVALTVICAFDFQVSTARVSGSVTESSGAFKIDQPLDPVNRYPHPSLLESPDMMNICSDNIALDANGEAVVQVPAGFESLNREFRHQLTALGTPGPGLYIAEEIGGEKHSETGAL